jgi:hypothetical protein
MRLFWSAVLVTGLVLVGIDTYDRRVATAEGGERVAVASEDGTPMPYPYPTPSPRPKTR